MHCYVCMARACMHIVLRRSADACLIVPETLLPARPGHLQGLVGAYGRRRRHQAASGGVQWLTSKTISVPVSLLQRRPCIRPYLCVQIQRAHVPLHGRHEHSAWINRLVRPALLALYCMPGSQSCFAECIAMCAWRAHVCILSCGVLLMLA